MLLCLGTEPSQRTTAELVLVNTAGWDGRDHPELSLDQVELASKGALQPHAAVAQPIVEGSGLMKQP